MATLKELSEYTGFSITTISRVLNNDPTMSVSDSTRASILEAAGKLHYKTTPKPRKTQAGAGKVLRFAIAEMLSPAEQLADPYYLYLRSYAEQRCVDLNIEIARLFEREGAYQLNPAAPVDGVLAIGIFSEEQLRALSTISRNLVFLDSAPDELQFDSVVINFKLGVEQALDHLLSRGHRKIGFVGPDRKLDNRKRPAPEVRRQYFVNYLRERSLFHEEFVFETPMDARSARGTLLGHIHAGHQMPTALLTANEECAIGAVGALHECGLRVPEDVSIISFNDTAPSALTNPPLTSVSTHVESMSAVAIEILVHRAQLGHPLLPLKIVVPPTLIERESVYAPAR